MVQYSTNPTRMARELTTSQTNLRNILRGKSRITANMALRLAKFFGTTPIYWLTLQTNVDLAAASQDKELSSILKGIVRAKKSAPKPPTKAGRKPSTKKT
jgi:addiction module HigA family antidote